MAWVEPWQASQAESAVPEREAIEIEARGRNVRLGGEDRIDRLARQPAGGEDGREADLAGVVDRGSRVAVLAGRLVEPAGPRRGAHRRHVAVAVLTLHRGQAVGADRLAHRAAQAARRRSGMTAIAGVAQARSAEREAGDGILDGAVKRMHGRGQRRETGDAAAGERVRRMTGRAEDGTATGDGGLEAGGVEAVHRQRVHEQGVGELLLVMEPEDVAPVVALRVGVVHPTGRRASGVPRTRGVAGRAVHLVGDRQDDARFGEDRGAVPRDDAHHRVGVPGQRVVDRRDRNPFGAPPVGSAGPGHRLRRVRRAGHVVSGQALVLGERDAEEVGDVVPEVRLADRGAIDRARRIGDRFVGQGEAPGCRDEHP